MVSKKKLAPQEGRLFSQNKRKFFLEISRIRKIFQENRQENFADFQKKLSESFRF